MTHIGPRFCVTLKCAIQKSGVENPESMLGTLFAHNIQLRGSHVDCVGHFYEY